MGAVSLWLEVCELNPSINKPGVLARGEVLPWPTSAREKLVVRTMPTSGEPVLQRLPCGLGDLKGNGSSSLLLNDCRARPDRTARGHIANAQFYEVASAELR